MQASKPGEPSFSEPGFSGGGTSGELFRSIDWSKRPVGAISTWPAPLRTAVQIILNSRHPMFLWWGPELIQFYNDAYLPSFGKGKHPAAMGQAGKDCWQEIWHIIGPQIEDVMTRGIPSWNEDALVPIWRNGRIEDVYWTYGYSPVFLEDGRVGGTLVVCTETTSRVLAERRLRMFRTLIEAMSGATSEDEVLAAAMQALQQAADDLPMVLLTRRPPGSEPERLARTGGTPEQEAEVLQHLARARPTRGEPFTLGPDLDGTAQKFVLFDLAGASPARGPKSLVFALSPRLPVDASYREYLGQLLDRVDQARARVEAFRLKSVAESERRNLLLQAPVATALLTGPDHRFELANALYVQMVGREVLGKAYLEAFPELAGTELPAVLDRVMRTGEPFATNEVKASLRRGSDGELEDHYFKFNLEPIREPSGEIFGMMAVAVDVTEMVLARQRLEKAHGEREVLLEHLRAANRAKDEFLAIVSHELRTPLSAIVGWTRLLSGKRLTDEKQRHALQVIDRSAHSQAKLIDDILDVSRIVSGKLNLSRERVDPLSFLEGAVQTVRLAAEARGIALEVELAPCDADVVGDQERLQQVIWNLLHNAIKFSPAGTRVALRARPVAGQLQISVSDQGRGIAPDFLPHVFDRFRQAESPTTRTSSGLGLGMAISKHLVEQHGGAVTAESAGLGRGATFTVTLPLQLRVPSSGTAAAPVSAAANDGLTQLRGVHVLVVDDDPSSREILRLAFELHEAQVSEASNAEEALELLASRPVKLLVSDIGMPGQDGYRLMRRLRQGEILKARNLPAIALTAYAREEDRADALAAGFQLHVTKPVEPDQLLHRAVGLLMAREG